MSKLQSINSINKIPCIQSIVALVLLVIVFIPDLSTISIVWWGIVGTFIMVFMLYQIKSNTVITNSFFFIKLCFIIWCCLSVFYIKDPELVWNYSKTSITGFLILFLIMSCIDSKYRLTRMLDIYILAACILCIYILTQVEWSLLGKVAIGEYTLNNKWNANEIGFITATAAIMAINNTSFYHKKAYYIAYGLLAVITVLTASRKAMVCLVVGTAMCLGSRSKNLATKLIKLGLIGLVIYIVITYVPFFYDLVGIRFEKLILGIMGKEQLDHSSLIRFLMIKNGFSMFLKSPLIGHGVDSYRLYSYDFVGRSTYAHNNYIEVLFDIGIVGFILYYILYIIILYRLCKEIKVEDNKLYLILLSLVIVMEIGMVSYNSLSCQLIILFCYCATKVNNKQKQVAIK